MKVVKRIPVGGVIMDKWPINESGLATTMAVSAGRPMPPIKVRSIGNGQYVILDGRHRTLAYKLLGRKTILAVVSQPSGTPRKVALT